MLFISGGLHLSPDPHESVRLYLQALYESITGSPMPPILREPGGKPYFAEGKLFCSLTHTKTAAFCALSDQPVGLDAEALSRQVSPNLAGKILSPVEYTQWEVSRNPQKALLSFWVLKEAYVKYTGEGLRKPFQEISFDLDSLQLLAPKEPLNFTLLKEAGHLLAVCATSQEPPIFQK